MVILEGDHYNSNAVQFRVVSKFFVVFSEKISCRGECEIDPIREAFVGTFMAGAKRTGVPRNEKGGGLGLEECEEGWTAGLESRVVFARSEVSVQRELVPIWVSVCVR